MRTVEDMAGQHEDLAGTEAATQEIVEEEVVELVGSHEVFGLLLDVAILVGRDQLWRDRRGDDVEERRGTLVVNGLGNKLYEILDEGLRYRGVDTIHAHVVTIVGSPSQSEFREVTGAYDETAKLVGEIHEDLRTLTGLTIFVSDIMHLHVMSDVLEVLCDALGDADLTDGFIRLTALL